MSFQKLKIATVLGLAGLTGAWMTSATDAPTLTVTEVTSGLQAPWDLAFMPDGKMLYTEKCLGLSVLDEAGEKTRLFGNQDAALVAEDLFCEGQSGMGSVVLDPSFTENRYIYVYMSSMMDQTKTNRVVRLTMSEDFTAVSDRTDIVTDIAYKAEANAWGAAGSHSGSRMRFGPDGYLYITTGDNHNGTIPQDLTVLGGKVLRVDRDGAAAAENAPPEGADARIFTYGHRNPQGLTFHPVTGQTFVAEHGPNHSDEVTALVNGGNAGWDPQPQEGVTCEDNYCGYISNRRDGKLTPMTNTEKFSEAIQPKWTLPDSQGMGPATFVVGEEWKSLDGALLVGLMKTGKVMALTFDEAGNLTATQELVLPTSRYRSLVQHSDGSLYFSTDEGAIMRVVPQ